MNPHSFNVLRKIVYVEVDLTFWSIGLGARPLELYVGPITVSFVA